MKSLCLISCTRRKRNHPCKAFEMYSASALFRKAYAYCIKKYDDVAILSAKYGFLLPEDEIEPYNKTLNDMSVEERKAWSEKAFKQMQTRLNIEDYDKLFFHAGRKYREYLIPKMERAGLRCEVPLGNMPIGKQLAWYKAHDC